MNKRPRLLIEEWLPAAAIGVECMREEGSLSAKPPTKYFHIWWARRPLTVSRAAVLGSLLPAHFPQDIFERLLGFARPGDELVKIRKQMDTGRKVEGGFACDRAFKRGLREDDVAKAHAAANKLFGRTVTVLDPMAGGGSIPLESARLGFNTLASEYNPVACSVLEATVDYPFRFDEDLLDHTRHWAGEWLSRVEKRLASYYPRRSDGLVHSYIFVRTVPCPDTGFDSPLVPDWHLLKPKGSTYRLWAEPVVDKKAGTWSIRFVESTKAGKGAEPPRPTYNDGKGISVFTDLQISPDYINAKAQAGEMRFVLYAVAVNTPSGRVFHRPSDADITALAAAERRLARVSHELAVSGIMPVEDVPLGDKTSELLTKGMRRWRDLFTPRQLLCNCTFVEELNRLRQDILAKDGAITGEAVVHLLALAFDKFVNHNCSLTRWENTRGTIKGKMDRHDYAFKPTFAELAPCGAGIGFQWCLNNTLKAYEEICGLAKTPQPRRVEPMLGSATNLPAIADASVEAVVVDPPYSDNVQYSELADFFYVWLKRTQGHRRPKWFSSNLCDHTEEAVVNVSRYRKDGEKTSEAKRKANEFYQKLMRDTFKECRRILRDDGVLTVMFTHKKQEAWEALFTSLVKAGFTITATWPVKTESEHSLHQAKKNAAQSTVILVARKRHDDAEVGYFDAEMKRDIRRAAQKAAERLQKEGLNPVDQLVGSFGPAMEVYSRYSEVRTDTGDPVGVDRALDEASEAVTAFRIQQLSERGLQDVEAEGRFYLLCWDVLQAAEFRFNEAKLLGHAVGMDVDSLAVAGLISKSGDKIKLLSAKDRKRPKKLEPDEVVDTLFGEETVQKRRRKADVLKVHPNDPQFRTALDACHALALRYIEAGGGKPGLGSARQLATQQGWKGTSPVARLMEALLKAAPPALWFEKGKKSAAEEYPEFRAWHAMIEPLFGVTPPEWVEEYVEPDMPLFAGKDVEDAEHTEEEEESAE